MPPASQRQYGPATAWAYTWCPRTGCTAMRLSTHGLRNPAQQPTPGSQRPATALQPASRCHDARGCPASHSTSCSHTHPRPCRTSSGSACRWPPGSSPAHCRGPAPPPSAAPPPALAAGDSRAAGVRNEHLFSRCADCRSQWCYAQCCGFTSQSTLLPSPCQRGGCISVCDTAVQRHRACIGYRWRRAITQRTWKYCV